MPQIQDCKRELREMFSMSQETDRGFIDVNAGHLHQRVFGVHAFEDIPVCCAAMRAELQPGDSVVEGDEGQRSGTFTIRYLLPRPVPVVQGDAHD
jgi:hypothetical protein